VKTIQKNEHQFTELTQTIKAWAADLGFQQTAITDINLADDEAKFNHWIDNNMHGSMDYMSNHGAKRTQPELLIPSTIRIISLRMNYYPEDFNVANEILNIPSIGYVARYALGRDYHKLIRQRLKKLVAKIHSSITNASTPKESNYDYRVFTDSAPVLEKAIAQKAGLGWIGKHTNLINSQAGSWFFLAEIYTNIPLKTDQIIATQSHCGSCDKCITACPTGAIVEPYVVDARKCISYLTIESKSSIPTKYRKAMGNRIYGCDDCQIVCPWNKFSKLTDENDFHPRHKLDKTTLLELIQWTEVDFLENFKGSPIRRIGYISWLRNISVALGNYLAIEPENKNIIRVLNKILEQNKGNDMITEHVQWALENG